MDNRKPRWIRHFLRHLSWITTLMEGMEEGQARRGRPRQEYLDEIISGRRLKLRDELWKGIN
ncbi:hypothetical protein J437_LFUL002486 [Ladona fulva]|uniref:Uncharacterized protein n=1 Tax=Ladona fulva TaxID=123851 RepID=A0A8K0JSJ9_LADFU|nr:hypothetical protein J437_LFUL002486 [Ladona fulva]